MSSDSSEKMELSSINSIPVLKVELCGDNNQYIIIGGKKYHREDLNRAFGGTFQVERYAPPPKHEFANPSPLGLAAFGITTLVLGLYYAGAKSISVPAVITGMAAFFASSGLFLAGVWEMVLGNTFASTTFCSFGAFWWAFMTLSVPSFGIGAAYKGEEEQLENAIGFFLLGWVIFIFILVMCTLKSTWVFFGTFFLLWITFILLSAAQMSGKHGVHVAGGVMAVITALFSLYLCFAGIANKGNSYIVPHAFPMPVPKKNRWLTV